MRRCDARSWRTWPPIANWSGRSSEGKRRHPDVNHVATRCGQRRRGSRARFSTILPAVCRSRTRDCAPDETFRPFCLQRLRESIRRGRPQVDRGRSRIDRDVRRSDVLRPCRVHDRPRQLEHTIVRPALDSSPGHWPLHSRAQHLRGGDRSRPPGRIAHLGRAHTCTLFCVWTGDIVYT